MTKTNDLLNQIQADATIFYQKLRAFHWTITGESFFALHQQFEELYERWADIIDQIAEREQMIGSSPLLSLNAALQTTKLREVTTVPPARDMVSAVVADLRYLLDAITKAVNAAEQGGDRGTANLLEEIRDKEEKALWMLEAWIRQEVAIGTA
jgi:starvation-inducible DNA-binding protein